MARVYKDVSAMTEEERKLYIFDLVYKVQKFGRPGNDILEPFMLPTAVFWMKKLGRYHTIGRTLRQLIPPSTGYKWEYDSAGRGKRVPNPPRTEFKTNLEHIIKPEYIDIFAEAYVAYELQQEMAKL